MSNGREEREEEEKNRSPGSRDWILKRALAGIPCRAEGVEGTGGQPETSADVLGRPR